MKAIRNTLFSLTLLASVSVVYYPKTLADGGQTGLVPAEPVNPVSAEPVHPVSAEPVHPVSAEPVNPVSAEPVNPVSAEPVSSVPAEPAPEEVLATKTKGFIPAVVGFALCPFKYVDRKAASIFEGVGGWGLWKERWIGKKLQNHKIVLGRLVVIAALGSAGYYAWNKYQEWKKQNEKDEKFDFRAFFDENEEDADVTFPTNAQ